jgi:hypothetical protein
VIETRGPWPYCKDKKARIECKDYTDAFLGKISGLMALVYCPICDKNKEYPIVQYKTSLASVSEIWLTTAPRRTNLLCHKCKHPVYLLFPPRTVRCPRCKKGTFEPLQVLAEEVRGSNPVPPPKTSIKVRQNGKTIHIPKPTVVIDSAEHMGYRFERFTNWFAGTIRRRLRIGDYTILGMEHEIAVERKTTLDLVKSVIHERTEFIKKCEKLSTLRKRCLVVEGSLSAVKTPYEETRAHPNAVLGTLLAAQERWDIPVYFLDDFFLAEEFVASMFSKYHAYRWLETNGYQRCLIEGDI